jgi:hypothetical protein
LAQAREPPVGHELIEERHELALLSGDGRQPADHTAVPTLRLDQQFPF